MSLALPTPRDDHWRYANLRPLAKARATRLPASALTLARPGVLPGFQHWVFVDGHFRAELSTTATDHSIWLGDTDTEQGSVLRQMLDTELAAAGADFALARANAEHGGQVLMVYPPEGSATPLKVELTFLATQAGAQGTSYPRVQIHAARGSQLELVERHLSFGDAPAVVNAAVDVGLAADAQVEHVRLQNCGAAASCFDTLAVQVGERAAYRLRTVTLGAASSRSTIFIRLTGREAACELTSAALAQGTQTQDLFAEIEHLAPATRTRELFRGIAAERGKLAFNGKMIVREGALDADSDQSLKTLLTGASAEAAARPQLEIYTDRVRARHGATTGKLDEQMLFYLLSRGIERVQARALLQWAFVEGAVSQIRTPALRQEIERLIAARLEDVSALGLVSPA